MLINLINDLLDLAKMNSLNFKFNNSYFDLADLIQKAYESVKFIANQKNIEIKQVYDLRIENPNSDFFGKNFESQDEMKKLFQNVYGDEGRYMQCLLNFLSNAIKFSRQDDSITVRLTLLEAQKIQDENGNSEILNLSNC